ncbi:hypothetical protein THAOC_28630 [Thalassiosira oceanica]|uniref:Uncharacterized protein n=1 Tax=Thalassiosira oceanica TaxID=159749 RepID=K0REK1_THAOC|nr:hypothetical protein THAOC_28630 [Thalassiosira oceanica]|eukprot:EJK52133.1 hypothetical protein THAOC_28630 [Thalassiosira oceanica]
MLDVLSSGGVTDGQALAQGPYLKIRWAVGVSRGRWDRRRGVEEALDFPETGSGRPTIKRNIARRGGLFALSFMVGVERLDFGWNSALFQDSERRSLHATPVPQKVVPAGSATQNSPYNEPDVIEKARVIEKASRLSRHPPNMSSRDYRELIKEKKLENKRDELNVSLHKRLLVSSTSSINSLLTSSKSSIKGLTSHDEEEKKEERLQSRDYRELIREKKLEKDGGKTWGRTQHLPSQEASGVQHVVD